MLETIACDSLISISRLFQIVAPRYEKKYKYNGEEVILRPYYFSDLKLDF